MKWRSIQISSRSRSEKPSKGAGKKINRYLAGLIIYQVRPPDGLKDEIGEIGIRA